MSLHTGGGQMCIQLLSHAPNRSQMLPVCKTSQLRSSLEWAGACVGEMKPRALCLRSWGAELLHAVPEAVQSGRALLLRRSPAGRSSACVLLPRLQMPPIMHCWQVRRLRHIPLPWAAPIPAASGRERSGTLCQGCPRNVPCQEQQQRDREVPHSVHGRALPGC